MNTSNFLGSKKEENISMGRVVQYVFEKLTTKIMQIVEIFHQNMKFAEILILFINSTMIY